MREQKKALVRDETLDQEEIQKPQKNLGWLAPILVVLTGMLPSIYLYAQNSSEASLKDIWIPLATAFVFGLLVFGVLYLVFGRDAYFAGTFGTILAVMFFSFNGLVWLTTRMFHSVHTRYAFAFALIIGALLLVVLLLVRKKHSLRTMMIFLSLIVSTVLVINVATAIPGAIERASIRPAVYETPKVEKVQPNIYYFIADEYAEFNTAKEYFLYDNSAFRTFLTGNGFDVSDSSFNISEDSYVNISGNFNLHDMDPKAPEEELKKALVNAKMYKILNDMGYSCYEASSIAGMFGRDMLVDTSDISQGPMTIEGRSLTKILMENTMLRPIMWRFRFYKIERTAVSEVFDYMKNPENLKGFTSNTAIFCYVLSPHAPWMHYADGSIRPREEWTDSTKVDRYVDQYIYVTNSLQTIIQNILNNDPKSIIILQSDHNYRCAAWKNDLPPSGKEIPRDQQRQILNAVYFMGEPVEIEGLSGPNTVRYILNRLGVDLQLVDNGTQN